MFVNGKGLERGIIEKNILHRCTSQLGNDVLVYSVLKI
jgi:hypothetical protein